MATSPSSHEFPHRVNANKVNDIIKSMEIETDDADIQRKRQHVYGAYSSTSIPRGARSLQNLDAARSTSATDTIFRPGSDESVFASMETVHVRTLHPQGTAPPTVGVCSQMSLVLPILHPFGPFRCCWDLVVMTLLVVTCIEVPLTLAFNISMTLGNAAGRFSLAIDILLLLDVVITFRTAFFNKWDKLKLVIDERKIAKKYLTGWFAIDLLTSIPFEFMVDPDANRSNVLKFVKVFRVFRFARIVKILRLFKMIRYFDGFMSQFVIRELLVVLKFAKILALMLFFAHLSACAWFFAGYHTMESESGSWVSTIISEDKEFVDDLPLFTKYSYCWYWAVVTLFTTGYGDITATHGNTTEQWLVSLCILVGTCFFAYFIGTLTSLITEGDRIKSVELQKLEEAQAFCDMHKLPRELSRAILTHIRYHCGYNYVFDENDLFESLPPYLQKDIHSYLAQTVLMQIDFFREFKTSLLGQIALKMRSVSCNENYHLFQKGERAHYIYVQRTGESTMDYHDGWTRTMKRGDVIGENALLSPKRKTTVVCDTFSEFYILGVQDIIAALTNEYPQTWPKRWSKMAKRLKQANKTRKRIVRTVDFDKHESDKHEAPKKPSESDRARSSMMLQSTIRGVQRSSGVATVQLNSIGHVDSPLPSPNNGPEEKAYRTEFETQHQQQQHPHLMKPLSLHMSNSAPTPPQPPQPQAQAQAMDTTLDDKNGNHNATASTRRMKRRMFSGTFLARRSSFERDHAIRRKRHAKRGDFNNAEQKQEETRDGTAFYDDKETDSSDDSADIVPKELRDMFGDDDVVDSAAVAHSQLRMMRSETTETLHDDVLLSMDTALTNKKKVQFKEGAVTKKTPSPPPNHIMSPATKKKPSAKMGAMGGKKGGKFGGKKRAAPMTKKTSKNSNAYAAGATRRINTIRRASSANKATTTWSEFDVDDSTHDEEKETELDAAIMSVELKIPRKNGDDGGAKDDAVIVYSDQEEQRNGAASVVEIEFAQPNSNSTEHQSDGFAFTEHFHDMGDDGSVQETEL